MKIVIALGGNALGNNVDEQKENIKKVVSEIKPLFDHELIITHGNGPQVGMINKVFSEANIEMPLSESTAMSEGYIGYHLVQELNNELRKINSSKKALALITNVAVSKKDKAFSNPTKPIGKFYTKEEADELSKKTGDIYKEDAGRGYRKYVASPMPIDIYEKEEINSLCQKNIVVAVGGGGIPYNIEDYSSAECVIDKDKASSVLASKINADLFIIITAVPTVQINFNTENAQNLFEVTTQELERYLENNEFKEGSMKPKIEAAINFIGQDNNKKVIITSIENINNLKNTTQIRR